METQEITKRCSQCGSILPINDFYRCARQKMDIKRIVKSVIVITMPKK